MRKVTSTRKYGDVGVGVGGEIFQFRPTIVGSTPCLLQGYLPHLKADEENTQLVLLHGMYEKEKVLISFFFVFFETAHKTGIIEESSILNVPRSSYTP